MEKKEKESENMNNPLIKEKYKKKSSSVKKTNKSEKLNKKEKRREILNSIKEFIKLKDLKKNIEKRSEEKEIKEEKIKKEPLLGEKKEETKKEKFEKIPEENFNFFFDFEPEPMKTTEIVPIIKKRENEIEPIKNIEQFLEGIPIKGEKEESPKIYSERQYVEENYKEEIYSEIKKEIPGRRILEESHELIIKTQRRNPIKIQEEQIFAREEEKFEESIKYDLHTPNGEKRTLLEKPEKKYDIRKRDRRI